MNKVAILVEDNYQVLELWYPYFRLIEAGIEAKIIGTCAKEIYSSKEGYPAKADMVIDKANSADFDGVIIPGGYAPDILRRYPPINIFVKEIFDGGKLTAAICHGAWVLVSAGVLRGKRATCFFAVKDDVINAGATYLDKEVVVDGNLITSRKPEDLPYFLSEILNFLRKR